MNIQLANSRQSCATTKMGDEAQRRGVTATAFILRAKENEARQQEKA
jgi:hypothetical protein